MKNGIKPPSLVDICEKSKMPAEEVSAFLELEGTPYTEHGFYIKAW